MKCNQYGSFDAFHGRRKEIFQYLSFDGRPQETHTRQKPHLPAQGPMQWRNQFDLPCIRISSRISSIQNHIFSLLTPQATLLHLSICSNRIHRSRHCSFYPTFGLSESMKRSRRKKNQFSFTKDQFAMIFFFSCLSSFYCFFEIFRSTNIENKPQSI